MGLPLGFYQYARKARDFFIYRVLHADDSPHRIALGVAIGIFVAWTPTIGFQMALVVAIAWLLDANQAVGIPFVWLTNPFTLVPVYLPNYYVGRWILGSKVPPPDFAKLASASGGWFEMVRTWWSITWHAMLPLWVGSLLVALVLGAASYCTTYFGVIAYRRSVERNSFRLP